MILLIESVPVVKSIDFPHFSPFSISSLKFTIMETNSKPYIFWCENSFSGNGEEGQRSVLSEFFEAISDQMFFDDSPVMVGMFVRGLFPLIFKVK